MDDENYLNDFCDEELMAELETRGYFVYYDQPQSLVKTEAIREALD